VILRTAAAWACLAACEVPKDPPLSLDSLGPAAACAPGDPVRLTLSGTGLLPALQGGPGEDASIAPLAVRLERTGDLLGGSDGLEVPAIELRMGQDSFEYTDAETIVLELDAALDLVPGTWQLTLLRGSEVVAELPAALAVLPDTTITAVSPAALCLNDDGATLAVETAGLVIPSDGSALPTLQLAGSEMDAVAVEECQPLAAAPELQLCAAVSASLEGVVLPAAGAELRLSSPEATSCGAAQPTVLSVLPPPSVSEVEPALSCAGGATLVITGDGFGPETTVTIDDTALDVVLLDSRHVQVELPAELGPGTYPLTVAAESGCAATETVEHEVVAAPEIFFVDPPVTHTDVSIVATAMLTDVTAELTEGWLVDPSGTTVPTEIRWDPESPGRLQVVLPAGLTPGVWGMGFQTADDCGTELATAFTVSDELQVAIEELVPPFAWAYDYTPVEVFGPEYRAGLDPFADTPRLYLSARDGATAEPFAGVGFRAPDHLTGVVGYGLEPGEYDVMVINPDGGLGLLEAGLTVTEQRPPRVDSASPTSLSSSQDTTVTIRGRGFDDPWVRIKCVENETLTGRRGTVLDWDEDRILASLPSSQWNEALCVLEVNNADGAWSDFAALSVRNPADNLFPWQTGPTMVEARRGPVTLAGRTTPLSRYVYAFGGDDGTLAGAKSSVERAPIGVYGELGDWALLEGQGELPQPTTMAAAVRLDDYLYLAGGHDGTAALDQVWRARVLDPLEVPFLESVGLERSEEVLAPGRWSWRIAATYAADDPANPGGESLPGEVISVIVPEGGAAVRLRWTAVPDAVGYRVYRTAEPDGSSSALGHLEDVSTSEILDTGGTVDDSRSPLVEGALGAWAPLPAMLEEREGPCLVIVPDPHPDPERFHLYAVGGRSAAGALLDSVERLTVRVASPREQLVDTSWTADPNTLSEARYACTGFAVDSTWHSLVEEGESYVLFAGGLTGAGRATGTVDAARVGENGALEDWGPIQSITPSRGAFAGASAGNNLYVFGGQNGRPSKGGVSANLDADFLPDVENWNSLGLSMDEPRLHPGWAQESAILIVAGGETDRDAATATVEITHY
jgi:hypothetical protein